MTTYHINEEKEEYVVGDLSSSPLEMTVGQSLMDVIPVAGLFNYSQRFKRAGSPNFKELCQEERNYMSRVVLYQLITTTITAAIVEMPLIFYCFDKYLSSQ